MGKALAKLAEGIKDVGVMTYKDLVQPSMQATGKALATTFQFVFTPFTALQFVNDVVKANLQHKLQQYEEMLKAIPAEQRVEVHPELGVPIIQRLSYTTNDEIADMFISLLASASNIETLSNAHPSFISIIDRLSPDEARMLWYIYEHMVSKGQSEIPYVAFRARPLKENLKAKDQGEDDLGAEWEYLNKFSELQNWLTQLPQGISMDFPDKMHLYWANLISCGIVKDMKGFSMDKFDEEYRTIEEHYNLKQLQEENVPEKYAEVYSQPSFFEITELGWDFIRASVGAEKTGETDGE